MDDQRKGHPDPEIHPHQKGTTHNNYRQKTCLSMMWKILTVQIRDEIYSSLSWEPFPEEQKREQEQKSHYTLINTPSRRAKRDKKDLAMAWIDYKKVYDVVLQSWMIDCLKMYVMSDDIIKFIKNTVKNWKVKLIAGVKSIAEVKIPREITRRDALSSLLFVARMKPLNYLLRKCTGGYKLHKSQEETNHLIYMDGIKLFTKTEKNW